MAQIANSSGWVATRQLKLGVAVTFELSGLLPARQSLTIPATRLSVGPMPRSIRVLTDLRARLSRLSTQRISPGEIFSHSARIAARRGCPRWPDVLKNALKALGRCATRGGERKQYRQNYSRKAHQCSGHSRKLVFSSRVIWNAPVEAQVPCVERRISSPATFDGSSPGTNHCRLISVLRSRRYRRRRDFRYGSSTDLKVLRSRFRSTSLQERT